MLESLTWYSVEAVFDDLLMVLLLSDDWFISRFLSVSIADWCECWVTL